MADHPGLALPVVRAEARKAKGKAKERVNVETGLSIIARQILNVANASNGVIGKAMQSAHSCSRHLLQMHIHKRNGTNGTKNTVMIFASAMQMKFRS